METMPDVRTIDPRTLHGRSMTFAVVGNHLLAVLDDGTLVYLFLLPTPAGAEPVQPEQPRRQQTTATTRRPRDLKANYGYKREMALSYRGQGLGVRQIARELDIAASTVTRWLQAE